MLPYRLKCKKKKQKKYSKCAICGGKTSKCIKNQVAKGLFSSLGIRTPLSIFAY